MIRINDIEPIKSKTKKRYKTISNIEADFLNTLRKNKKPEDLIDSAIAAKSVAPIAANIQIEINILNHLKNHFSDIVLGRPNHLNSTINLFRRNGWANTIYDPLLEKPTLFGKEIEEIFGYQDRFRSNVGRGIWLAKQINIKTCPYCNAQFTILTTKHNGNEIAKFQFDHFFPKSVYPYLSISLYNLIPSCANCNITKSKKILNLREHYHPYFMDFAKYSKFKLKYEPDPALLTISTVANQDLEIEFVPKYKDPINIVAKHDKLYHISSVYNRHQDIAEELLIIAIIHTKNLVKAQMQIKGLFPDINYYYRYLLRNYHLQKDTLKRPLAKFTQDVAKQLKLI